MTMTVLLLIAAVSAAPAPPPAEADTASEIMALERKVMDGWIQGNPDPLLVISDADITYFHVMTERRVDGLTALKALVEPYRGRSLFDSYEMLEPKVQLAGDTAVLTYVLLRRNASTTGRWNATQVYQRKAAGWRVVHSHWSQNAPPLNPAPQR